MLAFGVQVCPWFYGASQHGFGEFEDGEVIQVSTESQSSTPASHGVFFSLSWLFTKAPLNPQCNWLSSMFSFCSCIFGKCLFKVGIDVTKGLDIYVTFQLGVSFKTPWNDKE